MALAAWETWCDRVFHYVEEQQLYHIPEYQQWYQWYNHWQTLPVAQQQQLTWTILWSWWSGWCQTRLFPDPAPCSLHRFTPLAAVASHNTPPSFTSWELYGTCSRDSQSHAQPLAESPLHFFWRLEQLCVGTTLGTTLYRVTCSLRSGDDPASLYGPRVFTDKQVQVHTETTSPALSVFFPHGSIQSETQHTLFPLSIHMECGDFAFQAYLQQTRSYVVPTPHACWSRALPLWNKMTCYPVVEGVIRVDSSTAAWSIQNSVWTHHWGTHHANQGFRPVPPPVKELNLQEVPMEQWWPRSVQQSTQEASNPTTYQIHLFQATHSAASSPTPNTPPMRGTRYWWCGYAETSDTQRCTTIFGVQQDDSGQVHTMRPFLAQVNCQRTASGSTPYTPRTPYLVQWQWSKAEPAVILIVAAIIRTNLWTLHTTDGSWQGFLWRGGVNQSGLDDPEEQSAQSGANQTSDTRSNATPLNAMRLSTTTSDATPLNDTPLDGTPRRTRSAPLRSAPLPRPATCWQNRHAIMPWVLLVVLVPLLIVGFSIMNSRVRHHYTRPIRKTTSFVIE
jgi:hypothetical protein